MLFDIEPFRMSFRAAVTVDRVEQPVKSSIDYLVAFNYIIEVLNKASNLQHDTNSVGK